MSRLDYAKANRLARVQRESRTKPNENRRDQLPCWLMIAFPPHGGYYALRAFAPAKSGKCWYRRLTSRAAAIACKRELVAAEIKYLCKKLNPAADDGPSQHLTANEGRRLPASIGRPIPVGDSKNTKKVR